jgi:serine/threonine protein kinase
MALPLRKFVKRLIKCGLITAEELSTFQERLEDEEQPKNAQDLARELILAGRLTRFQAQAVFQGKTRELLFDEYIVLDKIDEGGMGRVFKAKHRTTDRIVALKLFSAKAASSPDAVARFLAAVSAAAKLAHPNVLATLEAREHEGMYGLIMEFVEGDDLGRILDEGGPLPVDTAVDCVVQAARGLEYAHTQGIVHHDIKPANLLVDQDGTLKILGLGVSRVFVDGEVASRNSSDGTPEVGSLLDTGDSTAAEQACGHCGADPRDDVYALGGTLYRLLIGKAPHEGDALVPIRRDQRAGPVPSLREAQPEVSEALDRVFRKMVAENPKDRYQSMGEVVAALEACVTAPEDRRAPEPIRDSGPAPVLETLGHDGMAASQSGSGRPDEAPSRTGRWTPLSGRPRAIRYMVLAGAVAALLVVAASLAVLFGGTGRRADDSPPNRAAVTEGGEPSP